MFRYVIRRLVLTIPVMFAISIATFLLMRIVVGDPVQLILGQDAAVGQDAADRLRTQLGLNRPIPVQYVDWMRHVLVGDFGRSMRFPLSVREAILQRLPVTMELTLLALCLSMLVAIPLGVRAATRPGSWIDVTISGLASISLSIPNFWLGILLIFVFALKLRWLPSAGYVSFRENPLKNLELMLLPTMTLSMAYIGSFARYTRATVIEVLHQDYVRTARSKGLTASVVLRRHAMKNAMIPIVTVIGLELAGLVGGAVVTEIVFSLPGVGTLLTQSILGRDLTMVQGIIIFITGAVVLVNLAADLAYAWLDPRIRATYG